jgi:hypothetical protein
MVWSFEACSRVLEGEQELALFERGVGVFAASADVASLRTRLRSILSEVVTIIRHQRIQRLRERPVAPAKMDALIARLTGALKPDLGCIAGYDVKREPVQDHSIKTWRFGVIDKGTLVEPAMSGQGLDELIRISADAFRVLLTETIWHDFWQEGCDEVEIDGSTYPDGYWTAVLAKVGQVGPDAALLVPYKPIGDRISRWQYGQEARPSFLEIERLEGRRSGGGLAYLATVNGLEVFTAQIAANHSYLFSTHKLESITYRWVEPGKFVTAEFEDGDDPAQGKLAIRFSQEARWSSARTIKFVLTEVP